MCLEHENLMYAQFALSATNILRTHPDDEDLYSARQNYFVLALREQRKACAHIHSQNAEAVCLTSMVILHTSFAMIHERPLGNYNPPIEWLRMGRGAGAVMWKASAAVAPEMPASFKVFMESYQQVLSEQELRVTLSHPFDTVYAAIGKQTASDVLTDAYWRTLVYINNMQSAIDSGDSVHVLGRRLQAFPMVVPTKFIDQVELRDPCAFLVLAYYFAVAAQVDKEFWWLRGPKGDRTAANELRALNSHAMAVDESWDLILLYKMSDSVLVTMVVHGVLMAKKVIAEQWKFGRWTGTQRDCRDGVPSNVGDILLAPSN
ncbi:hypothetical protein LTR05_005664 [Lithohypha guttulata]|uniref:Uncharacterized protein n=1 Tax=Lithohypha guttulata TaxID=1690604 RepID=A0AAN7SZ68_9EURO|nr:hypothetical protein LTR05_005664 [Lithohypha guttulata]